MTSALVVLAKAPAPGRVKTRLCPPCTPDEAATIAEAALRDTLVAVRAAATDRRVLVLDGTPGDWPELEGFEVLDQRGKGLADRLAAAFDDVAAPAFLVGMDTPQLRPEDLSRGLAALASAEAVLGPASDGGYWGIGLRRADAEVFRDVPMSVDSTAQAQRSRIESLGLRCAELRLLEDVDTWATAVRVGALAPAGRFAAALRAVAGASSTEAA